MRALKWLFAGFCIFLICCYLRSHVAGEMSLCMRWSGLMFIYSTDTNTEALLWCCFSSGKIDTLVWNSESSRECLQRIGEEFWICDICVYYIWTWYIVAAEMLLTFQSRVQRKGFHAARYRKKTLSPLHRSFLTLFFFYLNLILGQQLSKSSVYFEVQPVSYSGLSKYWIPSAWPALSKSLFYLTQKEGTLTTHYCHYTMIPDDCHIHMSWYLHGFSQYVGNMFTLHILSCGNVGQNFVNKC